MQNPSWGAAFSPLSRGPINSYLNHLSTMNTSVSARVISNAFFLHASEVNTNACHASHILTQIPSTDTHNFDLQMLNSAINNDFLTYLTQFFFNDIVYMKSDGGSAFSSGDSAPISVPKGDPWFDPYNVSLSLLPPSLSRFVGLFCMDDGIARKQTDPIPEESLHKRDRTQRHTKLCQLCDALH